jgi:hypothetical protein
MTRTRSKWPTGEELPDSLIAYSWSGELMHKRRRLSRHHPQITRLS